VPTPPNVAKLLDQIALADWTKNYQAANGVTPITGVTDPVQASALLQMAAQNQFQNYQDQVQPFQSLMQQLNQLYGNKYVSPLKINNVPVGYALNT
jgi:hypothetical protein